MRTGDARNLEILVCSPRRRIAAEICQLAQAARFLLNRCSRLLRTESERDAGSRLITSQELNKSGWLTRAVNETGFRHTPARLRLPGEPDKMSNKTFGHYKYYQADWNFEIQIPVSGSASSFCASSCSSAATCSRSDLSIYSFPPTYCFIPESARERARERGGRIGGLYTNGGCSFFLHTH